MHKERKTPGFTARYEVDQLVYFEEYDRVNDAIAREKQIKSFRRVKKIWLIEQRNRRWKDLYHDLPR